VDNEDFFFLEMIPGSYYFTSLKILKMSENGFDLATAERLFPNIVVFL